MRDRLIELLENVQFKPFDQMNIYRHRQNSIPHKRRSRTGIERR